METQFFPNAINVPSFMQPLVGPDKPFDSTTIYRFTT
jgi:aldose 1-epimerase